MQQITRGIDYLLHGQGDVSDEWEESNANSCSEAIYSRATAADRTATVSDTNRMD